MKPYKVAKCGSADSKYFNSSNQFDKDMQKHKEDRENLKSEVRNIIIQSPVDMKDRFHIVCEVLREIKEEYGV